ncbi:STP1 protein [Plasmodium ovale wallikeri]|uniref:STP1 protein n=1 Tax=Plasmodium ovale wallikeri TaxID=864142 RepID=A0A1A9AB11_PLAOA|nr:STP1 protein [Plasmodium ovale wallikeri]
MELLNKYKNDEWELNKSDFLQICLEEFIREQNKIYSNSENTNLVMKNISIQNTKEDKMVLLDKWTERCRPIWEKFKSENAFKVLQYGWKKEEKEYLENIEQFENNILNENTKISYKEIKKEIWRRWMTKQAKFIGQFTQEKWFKSLVKQIEDVSDEYKIGEIKDDIFYSVSKMADHQGYTIHTRDIPVEVFFDMITNDIKKLIQAYGHKNCGLVHEELCEKIKKIITSKKAHILSLTDKHGQQKLISEWESQKKEFFNNLFEEEGFINMCYPPKAKGNANLQKLKSRHIEFCKEKDKRRSALGKNPEYNACKGYNVWINTETTSFTLEFLQKKAYKKAY